MCLNFDCGVQIKLGFAAEFSNVLVIYTHIIKKPEEMSFCQAHVTDFSQVSVSSLMLVDKKEQRFFFYYVHLLKHVLVIDFNIFSTILYFVLHYYYLTALFYFYKLRVLVTKLLKCL